VTEQSYNQMPVEARRGPENLEPSCHVGSGPLHAWQHWKPCRLVVTWQHRWHGNSVEEFNSAWTTDKVYGKKNLSALHYCKKNDTGVSPRYSYKLFLYLLFYITRKQLCFNLLFNVLLTTLTFLSFFFFFFFFFMASGHASKSIPSCIFLFSNKINNLPRFENCLVFSVIMDP